MSLHKSFCTSVAYYNGSVNQRGHGKSFSRREASGRAGLDCSPELTWTSNQTQLLEPSHSIRTVPSYEAAPRSETVTCHHNNTHSATSARIHGAMQNSTQSSFPNATLYTHVHIVHVNGIQDGGGSGRHSNNSSRKADVRRPCADRSRSSRGLAGCSQNKAA